MCGLILDKGPVIANCKFTTTQFQLNRDEFQYETQLYTKADISVVACTS